MNMRLPLGLVAAGAIFLAGARSESDEPPAKSPKVLKALDGPTGLEFIRTPFRDVVTYLTAVHGIPIEAEWEKLEKVGWTEETRITAEMKGFTLREALERILGDDVRFEATDKALLITIRSAAEIEKAATAAAKEAKIRRALDQAMHLSFTNKPLNLVVRALSEHHNIPVTFDVIQLEKEGWSERTPITFETEQGLKLRTALDKILGDRLAYVITDGKLLITTRAAAKK